jgi:hypothetical protein
LFLISELLLNYFYYFDSGFENCKPSTQDGNKNEKLAPDNSQTLEISDVTNLRFAAIYLKIDFLRKNFYKR